MSLTPYLRALGQPKPEYAHEVLSGIMNNAGRGLFHRNLVMEWLGWAPTTKNRASMTHILAWLSTVAGGGHLRKMGNRGKLLIYQRHDPRPLAERPPLTESELAYLDALNKRPE